MYTYLLSLQSRTMNVLLFYITTAIATYKLEPPHIHLRLNICDTLSSWVSNSTRRDATIGITPDEIRIVIKYLHSQFNAVASHAFLALFLSHESGCNILPPITKILSSSYYWYEKTAIIAPDEESLITLISI